jgi:hypothetical protein
MKLKTDHGTETITIYHTAFADTPATVGVRTIQTPASRRNRVRHLDEAAATAEEAFMLTNHPAPPAFEQTTEGFCYSTSVGDVLCITDNQGMEYWLLCAGCGFLAFGKGYTGQRLVAKHAERWERAMQGGADSYEARRYFQCLSERTGDTALPAAA